MRFMRWTFGDSAMGSGFRSTGGSLLRKHRPERSQHSGAGCAECWHSTEEGELDFGCGRSELFRPNEPRMAAQVYPSRAVARLTCTNTGSPTSEFCASFRNG